MITLLGQMAVHDLSNFLTVFATQGASSHKQEPRSCHLYSVSPDAQSVVLLFEWESLEKWHEFLNDAQVHAALNSSETKSRPQFTVLSNVGEFQSFGDSGRASRLVTSHRDYIAAGASLENLISAQLLKGKSKLESSLPIPELQIEQPERETRPITRKIRGLVGV